MISPPPPFANENLDSGGDSLDGGCFAGEMRASPPPPLAKEKDPDDEGVNALAGDEADALLFDGVLVAI